MELSIVILNYQSRNLIQQLLKGLKANLQGLSYEIIVVDNDKDKELQELLTESFPDVSLIKSPRNLGYAAGNNLGIAKARGKYILILNPDIVVVDQAIQKLYQFMEQHPEVGIAGPQLRYPNQEIQESCTRWPDFWLPFFRRSWLKNTSKGKTWLNHYFYREWDHLSSRAVDCLFGAALMVRKEALIKVGSLDERFFLYLEDTDWCRRFWQAGYKVYYLTEARLYHYHKRSSAEAGIFSSLFHRSSREHIKSFIKYFFKYRGQIIPK